MSALGHHWRAIRTALEEDRRAERSRSPFDEPEFLPAALEVIERPVSPTARLTGWVLLFGLIATLAWLVLGRVDVVASAEGRVLPSDDVKLVQPTGTGIVRRIYVHDGDFVRKGQALVDLDPTVSTAEEAQAAQALLSARLDVARNSAIANALSGRGIHFVAPSGTKPEVATTQLSLVKAQVAAAEASADGLAQARASALADSQSSGGQIRKYDGTLPLLDRQVGAVTELATYGYASNTRLLELRRQRRSEAGDRDVAVAQRTRAFAEAAKFAAQLEQSREQAQQTALTDLAKAQSEEALREDELTKAQQRSRQQRLTAPVDGTVQELAVHTIGGVVEPVKTIMVIVPNGKLEVEAKVLNKDTGFVRRGQEVAIKLQAFPFTRYGTVPGRIEAISPDSVEDRRLGPIYKARISLARDSISSGEVVAPLVPGMALVADIRIGRRSILSYLLSPLDEARRQAGREH